MKTLVQTLVDVLIALGYNAKFETRDKYYVVSYPACDQYMNKIHEEVIRLLTGDKFMEFYWGSSIQFIYIHK